MKKKTEIIIILSFVCVGGGGGGWSFVNCRSCQTSCLPQNKVQEYTLVLQMSYNCGNYFVKLA